jgi:FixJ family two-component response regulator
MSPCSAIVVVLVDDDAGFRSGVAALLRDDGHEVHEYGDPHDVAADGLEAAHFLATDHHVADLDGVTFADRVHQCLPALPIMLVTAYWTVEVEAAVAARPFLHLCRKPVDYDGLHDRIHALATL